MSGKTEIVHLGLRIAPETHQQIKALSELHGRSINNEIIQLIKDAAKKHLPKTTDDDKTSPDK